MNIITRAIPLLFVLLLAIPAAAIDLSGNDIVVPVVGQIPGANQTDWRTDLSVGNPDRHTPVTVDITFHAEAETAPQVANVTLGPREVKTFTGVIASLFGRETGSGFIRITTQNPADRVWARARIYNFGYRDSELGPIPVEFGQTAPAIPYDSLSRRLIVAPLPGDQGNRSNAGITNPNPFDVNVSLAWFEPDGSFAGAVSFAVPAESVYRINDVFAFANKPRTIPLSMEVTADLPVYVWGSVVRNENGDASFLVGTKGEE
jgi:hypothetical protein